MTALKEELAGAEKGRAVEAQRAVAEAHRHKREAEEADRIAAAEERGRAEHVAKMLCWQGGLARG